MNNLISSDYLMHYGVKGMRWGVRHDPIPSGKRSYGQRVLSKSNKRYDRMVDRVESRRRNKQREISEFNKTKIGQSKVGKAYSQKVANVSNKKYDKKISNIEARRQKKAEEVSSFNNLISKSAVKKVAVGAAVVAGLGIGGITLKNGIAKKAVIDAARKATSESMKTSISQVNKITEGITKSISTNNKVNTMNYINKVANRTSNSSLDKNVLSSIRKAQSNSRNNQTEMLKYLNKVANGTSNSSLDRSVLNGINSGTKKEGIPVSVTRTKKYGTDEIAQRLRKSVGEEAYNKNPVKSASMTVKKTNTMYAKQSPKLDGASINKKKKSTKRYK